MSIFSDVLQRQRLHAIHNQRLLPPESEPVEDELLTAYEARLRRMSSFDPYKIAEDALSALYRAIRLHRVEHPDQVHPMIHAIAQLLEIPPDDPEGWKVTSYEAKVLYPLFGQALAAETVAVIQGKDLDADFKQVLEEDANA